ncbi:MAG: hypothetical protein ACOC33_00800 [bacterium]
MMFNTELTEHEQIMFDAKKKLMEEKYYNNLTNKDVLSEIREEIKHRDFAKNLYDPFDPIVCEGKLKIDGLYYQQLMKNLDEQYAPVAGKLMVELMSTVKQIYEFVNINPELYGKEITFDLFNETTSEINRKLSKCIFETLDVLFYKLTPEQRTEKYKEVSESFIKELIQEGSDTDDAITFGVKTTVMENLVTKISFPFTCWSRINYLTESSDYGLVFDQDTLIELVDKFRKDTKNLSKVIATCI